MARTLANATFTASVPLSKAMEFLERFSSLTAQYQETPEMARLIAAPVFGRSENVLSRCDHIHDDERICDICVDRSSEPRPPAPSRELGVREATTC